MDYIALSNCPVGYTPYGVPGGSGSSVIPIVGYSPIDTNKNFTCKKDTDSDKSVEIINEGNVANATFWVDVLCGGERRARGTL